VSEFLSQTAKNGCVAPAAGARERLSRSIRRSPRRAPREAALQKAGYTAYPRDPHPFVEGNAGLRAWMAAIHDCAGDVLEQNVPPAP
jgi:hypothetical protein